MERWRAADAADPDPLGERGPVSRGGEVEGGQREAKVYVPDGDERVVGHDVPDGVDGCGDLAVARAQGVIGGLGAGDGCVIVDAGRWDCILGAVLCFLFAAIIIMGLGYIGTYLLVGTSGMVVSNVWSAGVVKT